jgi:drug/metabolite transporter (DMT)-like permease
MGLEQQLEDFKQEFLRTAPAGRPALYEAKIEELRFRRSGLSAMQAAALVCTWSAVLFLPVYVLLGLSRFALALPSELAFQVVYQGVFMSCLAAVAFNRAVALLGPSAATAIIALLPAAASLLAVPVLGEIPVTAQWAAIVMIGIGVCLATRRPSVRSAFPKHPIRGSNP